MERGIIKGREEERERKGGERGLGKKKQGKESEREEDSRRRGG